MRLDTAPLYRSLTSLSALALAIPVGVAVVAPARAQQKGETRCGANGRVQRYDGSQWNDEVTIGQCTQGENGHPREPQDGDQKCSPSGGVLVYSRISHSWQLGIGKCSD